MEIELNCCGGLAGDGLPHRCPSGSTKYVRLSAVCTENAGASSAKYDFLVDMAGKIKNIDGFTDNEGVKTLTVTLGAVYDTAWSTGKYLEVRVTNQEATVVSASATGVWFSGRLATLEPVPNSVSGGGLMAEKDEEKTEVEKPFKFKEMKSAEKPIIAADGHVVLSKEGHRCPRSVASPGRSPSRPCSISATGETVTISFDANKITPGWVAKTQERVEAADTLSLPKALADVILGWDVTDEGQEFPPSPRTSPASPSRS